VRKLFVTSITTKYIEMNSYKIDRIFLEYYMQTRARPLALKELFILSGNYRHAKKISQVSTSKTQWQAIKSMKLVQLAEYGQSGNNASSFSCFV
jgi:hypothetical protein